MNGCRLRIGRGEVTVDGREFPLYLTDGPITVHSPSGRDDLTVVHMSFWTAEPPLINPAGLVVTVNGDTTTILDPSLRAGGAR